MHKIEIETSQNVGIEYPTASLVERIFAFLIDYAIIIAYALVLFFTVDGFTDEENTMKVYLVLFLPVYTFYHFLFEYFNNGQSPGKRILNLKVMQLNGTRPTLGNYFTRWLLGLLELYLFMGSPAMFAIMFTNRSQRLGDIAAGTAVIKNKPLSMGKHIIDKQFSDDYEPAFPKVKLFNDKQAEVINAVLTNPVNSLRNRQLTALTDKIKEEYSIIDEEERAPKEFLTKLLDDYAFYYWEEENRGQIFELKQDLAKILG